MLTPESLCVSSAKSNDSRFGAVAIGRNEGERLKKCLQSLSAAAKVIYVDSGSTDGSVQWARSQGVDVIDLAMDIPFTAARARNIGFRHLREIASDLSYVQFIDGDCELIKDWPEQATSFLDLHPEFAAVCGRRRERHPDQSVYNWMCDCEWDGPSGQVRAFGGDVMVRVGTLDAVGGYRDDLIAGEEPELCLRLRSAGWHIWRLGAEMTLHDAAMTRFGQWWRRTQRSGYAFAQGAHMHGASPERYRVWESRRAWLWGLCLPLTCLLIALTFKPWGWAIWLIYPLQVLRQITRNQGSWSQRAVLALFQVLARFPEVWGQMKFTRDLLIGRQARLIEYK